MRERRHHRPQVACLADVLKHCPSTPAFYYHYPAVYRCAPHGACRTALHQLDGRPLRSPKLHWRMAHLHGTLGTLAQNPPLQKIACAAQSEGWKSVGSGQD